MAVDEFAIITLAQLKAYLGITTVTDDAVLEGAIDRASYQIEAYLGRKVVQRRFREWTSARGTSQIVVQNPPLGHVHYVGFGSLACMVVSSTVSTDVMASVSVQSDRMTLVRIASNGTETIEHAQFANHNTASELVTHVNTLTGFSATLSHNCSAYHIRRLAGRDLRNAPATLTFADQAQLDVDADLERGILYMTVGAYDDDYTGRFPRGPVSVLVDYDGGFETVPPDIVQACLTMAAGIYRGRQRDPGLTAESFGDYSYTLASSDAVSAEVARMLGPWKRLR